MIQFLAAACLIGHAANFPAPSDSLGSAVSRSNGQENRLQLVPIVSDQRLEYIEESPDGTRLLTHDRGYAPKLWDPRTMRILRVLGQGESIEYVTFSKDGDLVLTQSNTSVAIWDALKGRRISTIKPMIDEDTFSVSAISDDGKSCAVGTTKGWTATFAINNPDEAEWRAAHVSTVECLDWSPDSTKIATGATDGTAGTWDAKTQEFVNRFDGAVKAVRWIEWSVDGQQVLTTSLDDHARLYNAANGKLLLEQEHVVGEKGSMKNTLMAALFVGVKGDGLLTADRWGVMHILDRKTLKEIRTLPLNPPPRQTYEGIPVGALREIRKSRDGRRIGTYSTDEKLGLWDVDTGKEFPFDRQGGNPTAGEFSPNGEVFWVGYDDGTIRRHELETGKIRSTTTGASRPIARAVMVGSTVPLLWTEFPPVYTDAFAQIQPNNIWSISSLSSTMEMPAGDEDPQFSPDGRHCLMWSDDHKIGHYFDLASVREIHQFKDISGVEYSPDGARLLTWTNGSIVELRDANTLEMIKELTLPESAELWSAAPIGNLNKFVMVKRDGTTSIVNMDMPNDDHVLGKVDGFIFDATVSMDNKWTAVAALDGVDLWNLTTFEHKKLKGVGKTSMNGRPAFSRDTSVIALSSSSDGLQIWDVQTGESRLSFPGERWNDNPSSAFVFSPNRPWAIRWNGPTVEIWDYKSKMIVESVQLTDRVLNACFSPDGSKLITTDWTDGVVFWDITKAQPKRLGSFLVMQDGNWLVMDPEGRFDASDPSHVDGAAYVMEWENGLEPIAVSQLKAQFYEPDLLAKILGTDSDPARQVPDLSSLRLYPSVKLAQTDKAPTKVNISLEDRDNGGIGKTAIYLNGKLVAKKDGDGYIQFDASDYAQFLLPEPELQGHGNILSVQTTNEDGTLTSMPISIDVGVPAGLKTPEVNLYVLCVGVGDYAGNKGDLKASPKDASDLAAALARVGNRLLPNRVHVSTFVTGSQDSSSLPTRANILDWFTRTSKEATSSDILFVFLSGHGTSSIGSKHDYFYLTMEGDPFDVNEASASTCAISGDELRAALAKVAANKQVVVLDTCHSGAAASDLITARSLSGDYQRAWEQIKDTTGTWLLAATASDTLSYESANVDHGVLTYALLEALDKATPEGLKPGSNGDLFVDVEQWLNYAVGRVDSLKNEVGINGVQRPELRRSASNSSFSIGVERPEDRGAVGLKPPMPIVIVGPFEQDQEDPLGLEPKINAALLGATRIKPWFDVAKHPNVYRVAGTYSTDGDKLALKVFVQKFDADSNRKTLATFELSGASKDIAGLSASMLKELETRIVALENAKS